MSIAFGGASGSGRVNSGWTPSSGEVTAGTILVICQLTSADGWFSQGTSTPPAGPSFWPGANTGTALDFFVAQATGSCQAKATLTNFTAWGTGKWLYCAAGWDTAGAAGDQYLLMGDWLGNPAAEPSSYTNRTVGTGEAEACDTQLQIGNRSSALLALDGSIARYAWLSTRLTPTQAMALQFAPLWPTGRLNYDLHSTGYLQDLSGNGRNGTMAGTGYSDSDNAPIMYYPRRRSFVSYAVAATQTLPFLKSYIRSDPLNPRRLG